MNVSSPNRINWMKQQHWIAAKLLNCCTAFLYFPPFNGHLLFHFLMFLFLFLVTYPTALLTLCACTTEMEMNKGCFWDEKSKFAFLGLLFTCFLPAWKQSGHSVAAIVVWWPFCFCRTLFHTLWCPFSSSLAEFWKTYNSLPELLMASENFFMKGSKELIPIKYLLKTKRGNVETELFSHSLWKLQLSKGLNIILSKKIFPVTDEIAIYSVFRVEQNIIFQWSFLRFPKNKEVGVRWVHCVLTCSLKQGALSLEVLQKVFNNGYLCTVSLSMSLWSLSPSELFSEEVQILYLEYFVNSLQHDFFLKKVLVKHYF